MVLRFIPTTLFLFFGLHSQLQRDAVVQAFPSGAGACPLGEAAPQGSHLREGAITGSLADGGFEITIGMGSPATSDGMSFPVDTEVDLTISGVNGTDAPFTGFLIRLGPADAALATAANTLAATLDYREGETGIDVASVCTALFVGGVTHTDNSVKTSINAYAELVTPMDDMVMDVSVVVFNNATGSEYYYSSYSNISFIAADVVPAPEPEPAPAPTAAEPAPVPTTEDTMDGGDEEKSPAPAPTDVSPANEDTATSTGTSVQVSFVAAVVAVFVCVATTTLV